MKAYLSSSRLCEVDSDAIQEKADELAGETDRETSENIFAFVRDHVKYNIRRTLKGADAVLDDGEGCCFDKTNLLVALHRASGIPARYRQMKCELNVKDDDLPADAFHLVAEVKLDGEWQVLDPSFDDSVSEIVETSEWGKETWTAVHSQKTYAEIPFYLPYVINYLVMRFSRKVKTIQSRINELQREK